MCIYITVTTGEEVVNSRDEVETREKLEVEVGGGDNVNIVLVCWMLKTMKILN